MLTGASAGYGGNLAAPSRFQNAKGARRMNILIAGQKWFGAEVFRALRALPGVSIKAVCAPTGGGKLAGQANLYGVPVIASGAKRRVYARRG